MKQTRYFFPALLLVVTVLLAGTALIHGGKALGQAKGKPGATYGRNPFLFPAGNRSPEKAEAPPVKQEKEVKPDLKPVEGPPPPLSLRAILIGDHVRLASIDRRIVAIGDMIHEERVLEIKSDQVILGKGTQKRSLYLSQSPIRMKVEER